MNLRDLKLRAWAVLSPRRMECDLGDELAFHIDRETARRAHAPRAHGRTAPLAPIVTAIAAVLRRLRQR